MADVEQQVSVEVIEPEEEPSNWEFIDRVPSRDEVLKLLETLPDWWGVKPANYVDYVQALPSDKQIKVKEPGSSGQPRKVEKWFSVVTLYFSVAARIQMCREAQGLHGWRVNYEPEPITPTGVPGFIDLGESSGRIIYREYVEIWAPVSMMSGKGEPELDPRFAKLVEEGGYFLLGRRPGMAWVPATGGRQAKGSNPYEKVETAARGRALAAWGFGVLPGSGVASLEEMLGVRANAQAMAAESDAAAPPPDSRKLDKATLVSSILQLVEEARQLTERNQYEMFSIVADWFRKAANLDVAKAKTAEGAIEELDLSKANLGTLRLAEREFRRRVQQIRGEQADKEAEQGGGSEITGG